MKARALVLAAIAGMFSWCQLIPVNPVMAGGTIISAAGDNSFVLKSDGTLWAWGANNKGQLGDGTDVKKTSPVQIGTDKDWVSFSTGTYMGAYVLAIKADGTLWGWVVDAGVQGHPQTIDRSNRRGTLREQRFNPETSCL